MIVIKRILEDPHFIPQCCSCMRISEDCRAVEIDTENSYVSKSFTVCKDCLKDLQRQIKEKLDD